MKTLYIKQKVFKITDHYPILDEQQRTVYEVNQDLKFFGNTVHVSDANGIERFVVDKEIFTFLPRFVVRFSSGQEVILRSRMEFFKKKIDIEQDGPALYLEGDWLDFDFTVYRDSEAIGKISREFLAWGDTYQMAIYEPQYEELVVALTIAVDCIKDDQQRN